MPARYRRHYETAISLFICPRDCPLCHCSCFDCPQHPPCPEGPGSGRAAPLWESKEFYTSGGFQDSTDYAKYTYRIGKDQLEETGVLHPVKEDNIPDILAYVENFEKWVRTCDDFPKDDYDFDKSRIGVGDYFFILNQFEESEKAFWNYNLYYFDVDGILYYFHNNI